MTYAANIVTALVALLHVYFLVLEMFLWTKPAGRKAFGLSAERAESTKAMAANQASLEQALMNERRFNVIASFGFEQ